MHFLRFLINFLVCLSFLSSCGGGGESSGNEGLDAANHGCDGSCSNFNLAAEEVRAITSRAVLAAETLGVKATIAITDRVGNVLSVYAMPGALPTSTIAGGIAAVGGLEGISVPATLAAISKAGTGSYLSSQGNAFSTRTASQIIQEHFNPGERQQGGGPLFGVQFSQLICSDVITVNPALLGGVSVGKKSKIGGLVGPRPLPLGLSADPGGIPLYKLGDPVGGIGIELDGIYSFDRDITDVDDSLEERIALLATQGGFEIPSEISGDRIFALGKSLRTIDISYSDLEVLPEVAPVIEEASFVVVPFYFNGQVKAGATFGSSDSGIFRTNRAGVSAAVLTDSAGNPRFPSRNGSVLPGGIELKSNEVEAILDSSLLTAFRTRAAIRRPLDSEAHVSIWVVDTEGRPLGMVRSSDAPVFGLDVALQKARTAQFFSSTNASGLLSSARAKNGVGAFEDYAGVAAGFLGQGNNFGSRAFSNRSIGNLSRPFYPDGIDGSSNGPLSLPFPGLPGRTWSPFNTGLQLDLVFQRLVQPLGVPTNPPSSIPDSCTDSSVFGNKLRNGIQIFPGSFPLYRNAVLIGGIGVSGDGVDQDDLIAFYGASRVGLDHAGHQNIGDSVLGFNAPIAIRSDLIETPVPDTRLRYVNCPEGPFRGSNDQRVCEGM